MVSSLDGVCCQIPAGALKSLFKFDAAELVGRPLASVVDVFGLWRLKCQQDDTSLLSLLAMHTFEKDAASSSNAQGTSWRVGVHLPVTSDIEQHAAQLAVDGNLAKVNATNAFNLLLHATITALLVWCLGLLGQ
jgi:hypothetical protein